MPLWLFGPSSNNYPHDGPCQTRKDSDYSMQHMVGLIDLFGDRVKFNLGLKLIPLGEVIPYFVVQNLAPLGVIYGVSVKTLKHVATH
jgi:hypothetical protein